jgi:broad specificity phosphatase PhoE
MTNRYYLMRHGESQANKANLIVSEPEVGCKLYGLTPVGRQQAKESAEKSGLGSDTVIISSDFLRAKETAKVVRETLGCRKLLFEEGLRERYFGELEGDSGQRYRELWARDNVDPVHTSFGAESPKQLAARLRKTMERLEEQFKDSTLLLVSHGDTLRFLQLTMAERPLTEHLEIAVFEKAEIRALETLPPRNFEL